MTRPFQTKAFITRHFFMLAFPFVLLLALWWPSLGASGGLLRSEHTGKFAVALVFLVQGLTLSRRQIVAGALNPRFHVLTQGIIFLGFPLMGMLLMYVLGSFLTPELRDGFLILSVLPSTIASAAVLTAQAGGNVASALSASVCSNLLAIVLTPVWVRALLGTESLALPLGPILRSLSLMILAPLLLGNSLRLTRLRDFAESKAAALRLLNTSVILFIVLSAFSNAVQNDILQEQTPAAITIALLVSLLFFVISTAIAWVFHNIKDYGGNPGRIFISGHSAGCYLGDLVVMDKSYLAAHGIDANRIAGNISMSAHKATHFVIREAMGLPAHRTVVDALAPLYHVRADAAPTLLITGDRDLEIPGRYEENALFWRMMRLAGHPDTDLIEIPGTDHGGMVVPAFAHFLPFIRRVGAAT